MARTPEKPVDSVAKKIKSIWKKAGKSGSLKAFVKASEDKDMVQIRDFWFHNKTANFSKPPLGLGSTRKKKNKQQPKKAA